MKRKAVLPEKIITTNSEKSAEEVDVGLVWNISEVTKTEKLVTPYDTLFSLTCDGFEIFDACPSFNTCKSNLSQLYDDYLITLRQIEIFKLNHRNGLITMCYVGLFFGALMGGSLVFLICCLKDRKVSHMLRKTKEKQKLRQAIKARSQFASKVNSKLFT